MRQNSSASWANEPGNAGDEMARRSLELHAAEICALLSDAERTRADARALRSRAHAARAALEAWRADLLRPNRAVHPGSQEPAARSDQTRRIAS